MLIRSGNFTPEVLKAAEARRPEIERMAQEAREAVDAEMPLMGLLHQYRVEVAQRRNQRMKIAGANRLSRKDRALARYHAGVKAKEADHALPID